MEMGGEKIKKFSKLSILQHTHTHLYITHHTHTPDGGMDMSVKTVKKMLVLRTVLKEKEESEQQC